MLIQVLGMLCEKLSTTRLFLELLVARVLLSFELPENLLEYHVYLINC